LQFFLPNSNTSSITTFVKRTNKDRRTRAQAAGIRKCVRPPSQQKNKQASKAAKKDDRKRRRATQASASSPREYDNEVEEAALEEEGPFVIGDHVDNDPLTRH